MTPLGTLDRDVALVAIDTALDPFFLLDAVRDEAGAVVDFRYRYVNAAGLALYGLAREDVVGHRLLELFPTLGALGILAQCTRVATTGEAVHLHIPTFQIGERSPTLAVRIERQGDGLAIWVRDESPQAEAAEHLRRVQARSEALIQRSGDVILLIDAEGSLTYASPALARVLGYAPEEVLGRSAFDFVHPDDLHVAAESMASILESTGLAEPVTYRVRHADGSWRWMEDVANNLLDDPLVGGIVVTLRDVTAQRQAAAAVADLNRVLRTVTAADVAVVRATTEEELLTEMCRVVVETGGYQLAWIAGPDPFRAGCVRPVAVFGAAPTLPEQVIAASHGPVAHGVTTEAIFAGRTVHLADVAELPEGLPLRELSLESGYRSQIALPLAVDGQVAYALTIHAAEAGTFDADEIALFEQLATNLAFGISSLRTLRRAEHNLDVLVSTVAGVAEHRDPYTAGHQLRVAEVASAIAAELGLLADQVAGIEIAARLHDIGKIAVPSEILTKPGRLAPEELALIRRHAQVGQAMVQGIEFPWPVARMIGEHHERLDGSGYPNGLVGDQIHLGSQILAVADMVEAMVSHRPYRPGKGLDVALAQVESERGTSLDADVVDACLRLFRDHGYQLPT